MDRHVWQRSRNEFYRLVQVHEARMLCTANHGLLEQVENRGGAGVGLLEQVISLLEQVKGKFTPEPMVKKVRNAKILVV